MSTERGAEAGRAYRIVGRVQGVGFRWWTRRKAEELGLVGSVRNLPDGSVQVRAAGAAADLARLESALQRGPVGSRVDRVERSEFDPGTADDVFRIEH